MYYREGIKASVIFQIGYSYLKPYKYSVINFAQLLRFILKYTYTLLSVSHDF